jgi:hypothetical protein
MGFKECDWNPSENRETKPGDLLHAKATWLVGSKKVWHLCDTCEKLKVFNRYRKRRKSMIFKPDENVRAIYIRLEGGGGGGGCGTK